jgi:hypothetical protein
LVHEVPGLAAGALHVIEEPPTLVVEPADRTLPAQGPEGAVVRAFARHPDGSLRSGAAVEIRIAYGVGTFTGPAVAEAGGWRRTLTAPGTPGTTVFEVLVDGVALGVRPRVTWQ